jgi:hypothetical protein
MPTAQSVQFKKMELINATKSEEADLTDGSPMVKVVD